MATLRVVGMDPSMTNWGLAAATLDLDGLQLHNPRLQVVQPVKPKGKQSRVNSIDLEVARQLFKVVYPAILDAQAIFVEVPVGSQSAASMKSYGMCVGLLGALRALGVPFFEVTASEVKLAGTRDKNASKKAMIASALQSYPQANWPTYKKNGATLVSETNAEHMADALFAIHAGTQLPAFQQYLAILNGPIQLKETAA